MTVGRTKSGKSLIPVRALPRSGVNMFDFGLLNLNGRFSPVCRYRTPMKLPMYRIQFGIGQVPLDIRQLRFIAKDTILSWQRLLRTNFVDCMQTRRFMTFPPKVSKASAASVQFPQCPVKPDLNHRNFPLDLPQSFRDNLVATSEHACLKKSSTCRTMSRKHCCCLVFGDTLLKI